MKELDHTLLVYTVYCMRATCFDIIWSSSGQQFEIHKMRCVQVYWHTITAISVHTAGDHAQCVSTPPVCMDHPNWWPCTVCIDTSSLYGPFQLVIMHSVYPHFQSVWTIPAGDLHSVYGYFQSVWTIPAGDHAHCVSILPVTHGTFLAIDLLSGC